MKKVLVVEDEQDLADLLAYNLKKEGYHPLLAYNGTDGLKTALQEQPDLILLDQMLPGMTGTEICSNLRHDEHCKAVPVIMLTARGEEIDRIIGFELGADDYIVKPFSMRELMLRIKVIFRRNTLDPAGKQQLELGNIRVVPERCLVTVDGVETELTTTEFKLLHYLALRPGRVFGRELLLQDVWGYNYVGDTRTVDTHITRLRCKLGDAGEMIKTVRGFGYKLEPDQ